MSDELRQLDEAIAAMIEPKPPLAHCRFMHDTASPLGAWIHTHIYDHGYECEVVPRLFSADISLAMRVIEKMRERGWQAVTMTTDDEHGRDELWYVEFLRRDEKHLYIADAASNSLPEAVCRAALNSL